jgi:hypothetical protein
MAAPKYKQYVELMFEKNKALFDAFQEVHDKFMAQPDKYEDLFHQQGLPVLDVVRDWERRLCYGTEKGRYASYSAKLAEKFWEEVKKTLPVVDKIGLRKVKPK